MRPLGTNALRRRRATLICAALLLFLVLPDADAKTCRHRKQTAFSVTLQPFSLVPSVAHSAAEPVVSTAPRILRAVATAPIKVAYYAPRAIAVPASFPEQVSEDDQDQDQEQEQEEAPAQIERRGDRPTVAGSRAVLRNGIAYAPSRAPREVKNAIWAANTLRRKPYVWGGGHGSFYDHGYDCSGSVSFALHGASLLAAPMPSSDLVRYGERGRGRWITIYSRPGHTFAIMAGLRFDTTDLDRGRNVGPRWYVERRATRDFVARHPAGF
jgi:cell wall-associated NlpC family hydrolase